MISDPNNAINSTIRESSCFFCLQDSNKYCKLKFDSGDSNANSFTKSVIANTDNTLSLRHFSRFLDLFENNNDDDSENISNDFKSKLFNFASDSTVFICSGECSKMMKEFTELYHLMEVTKLRLSWCVQRMHYVMFKAKDKEQESSFPENDENLVEVLRTKTKDRMQKITSTSFPRVNLHRAELRTSSDLHNDNDKDETAASHANPSVTSSCGMNLTKSYRKEFIECQETTPCNLKAKKQSSSSDDDARWMNPLDEDDTENEVGLTLQKNPVNPICKDSSETFDAGIGATGDSDNNLKCTYCRATFSSTPNYGVEELLCRHILEYHCHHYFPNHKLDTITDSQFQKILVELLFVDLIKEEKTSFLCVYCKKPIASENRNNISKLDKEMHISYTKLHFIENHYEELEKKLRLIQTDPNLSRKLLMGKPNGRMCKSGCGVYFSNPAFQWAHDKLHCTMTPDMDNVVIVRNPRQNLVEVFPNKVAQEHHSPSIFPPALPEPSSPSTKRVHDKRGKKRKYRKAQVESISTLPASCPYCRYECSANQEGASMSRHLLRFHPQHYFPHANYQALGITQDQFQRTLQDILFPELTPVAGKTISCPFCRKQFRTRNSNHGNSLLRRHFVSNHNAELTDRLNVILADPNLDEKLTKANPGGMSCPCGMYLPDLMGCSQNHEKFQCKLKWSSDDSACIGDGGDSNDDIEIVENVEKPSSSTNQNLPGISSSSNGCQSGSEIFCPPIIPVEQDGDNHSHAQNKDSGFAEDVKSNETVKCPYCRAAFLCTQNRYEAEDLQLHILRYHCHHYFPTHKLDHVSDSEFQKILVELLFKDLVEEGKTSCPYCEKPFPLIHSTDTGKCLYRNRRKAHFLVFHYKELEKRLLLIQSSPNLSDILKECNPKGQMCRFGCGVYLTSESRQRKHEEIYCIGAEAEATIEQLPNSCRDQELIHSTMECREESVIPFPTSCPYCRYRCNSEQGESSMKRHLSRFHPQYFFPQLDYLLLGVTQDQFQRVLHDIIFSELVPVDGDVMSCRFCGSKFQGADNCASNCTLRRHLLWSHRNELTDQVRLILGDPNLKERLGKVNSAGLTCPCGMYLPRGLGYKDYYHAKFQCNLRTKKAVDEANNINVNVSPIMQKSLDSGESHSSSSSSLNVNDVCVIERSSKREVENFHKSCPYCRYSCHGNKRESCLNRHLLRFHPHHYFLQLDYQAMGVSLDQFQRVLHDIMFSELVPVVRGVLSCRYCGKKFQGNTDCSSNTKLRRHLVHAHGTELTEQLSLILRDPNLNKRLEKVNPNGISCPCGMYLPQGLSHGNHHDMFRCNFKANEQMEVDVAAPGYEMGIKYHVNVRELNSPYRQVQEGGRGEDLELSDEEEFKFNDFVQMKVYQDGVEEGYPLKLE